MCGTTGDLLRIRGGAARGDPANKGNGCYDHDQDGETGDLTDDLVRLNGYVVRKVVGKNDNPIAPAGAVNLSSLNRWQSAGGNLAVAAPTLSIFNTTTAQNTWDVFAAECSPWTERLT